MKDLGITKGEWIVDDEFDDTLTHVQTKNNGGMFICRIYKAWHNRHNTAKFIADAGNTAQKCGLLPSELLEQRDELLRVLNQINNHWETGNFSRERLMWNSMREAIKKATS